MAVTKKSTELERFAAFEKFHAKNPDVYELFKRFTFQAIAVNEKIGARLIGERIRWEQMITIERTDDFKINDHHWPFYARTFHSDFPQHRGFFETRVKKENYAQVV